MRLSGEAMCDTPSTDVCKGRGWEASLFPEEEEQEEEKGDIPPRVVSLISPPHLPDRHRNLAMNNQSATTLQFKYKVNRRGLSHSAGGQQGWEKGQERR